MTTRLLRSALLLINMVLVCHCQVTTIMVDASTDIAVIDDHFIGVTIDSMFLPTKANFSGLDLISPKVQLLASSLAPCYLRIGGTSGDEVFFVPKDTGEKLSYSEVVWDRLNKFVDSVGWDLVFGLNALRRNGLEWDPTNALELMQYTVSKKYKIAGFELGNEPQFFPGPLRGKISGSQLGRDFMTLRKILKSMPHFNSSLLIGADSQGTALGDMVFREFFDSIGSLAVDRITVHHYYAYAGRATLEMCLSPDTMDSLLDTIRLVYDVVKKPNPETPVWFGETSSFWGGGAKGLSNRYAAGFLWLDKLGLAAKNGIKAVIRQSFYGQNYSLLEKKTQEPLPDYWLTLLHKRLVGHKVFDAWVDTGRLIRVYAYCTNHKNPYGYPPGSLTFMYLNLHTDTPATLLNLPQFKNQVLHMYAISPVTPGNMTDRYVALNQKKIVFNGNTLPQLDPVKTNGPFVISQASTLGFIVVPDANVDLCKS